MYFVTILVALNLQPTLGWVQHTVPFDDKALCLSYVDKYKGSISLSVERQFGNLLKGIREYDCLTREDAVNRNTKLGH